ncbi:MAG: 4Fe-4S binding protein [Candidatus Omnitrophica bacterium]|nr:4Fe-4S binding protein [Candidatus Omnitrophota bacterium]
MPNISQLISLFLLGPLLLYPFSFCPFRLPYLYCFICPARCAWYRIRGVVLLIAVGLNIKRGLFCSHICPFGTIQILLSKISAKKISIPYFFRSFKYIGIALIASVIAISKRPQGAIFIVKLKGFLLATLLLSMGMSIFGYRIFCHNLCPINALSKIRNKITYAFR